MRFCDRIAVFSLDVRFEACLEEATELAVLSIGNQVMQHHYAYIAEESTPLCERADVLRVARLVRGLEIIIINNACCIVAPIHQLMSAE